MTTARNRAINRIRRDRTLAAKTRLLQVPQPAEDTMDATRFPDERLELIFTLHATRGELLRRLGRTAQARQTYRRTLALAHDDAERRLLQRRLAQLDSAGGQRQ